MKGKMMATNDKPQREIQYITIDGALARLVDSDYVKEPGWSYPLLWIITHDDTKSTITTTRDFRRCISDIVPYIREAKIEETWPKNKPLFVRQNPTDTWAHGHFSHFDGTDVWCYSDGRTSWTANGATTIWRGWREPTEDDLKDWKHL